MTATGVTITASPRPLHRFLTLLALIAMVTLAVMVFTPSPAAFADCKPDGIPAQAGTGVSGAIDPKTAKPSNANYYGDYGWAGLRWNTCDIGNTAFTKDNFAEIDTWAGNALMGGAAFEASLMTAMHKWTSQPESFLQPIDDKIVQLSNVTRTVLFDQWVYPVIVFAAGGVLMLAFTRKVRPAVTTVGVTILALGFVSVIATAPLTIARSTDGVASTIVSAADAQSLKYAGIPTGDDAKNQKNDKGKHTVGATSAEATGAVLNDAMIQPLWRLGEVGSTDWSENTDALWRASVASWSEVKSGYKPDDKRDDYNDAVDKVKNNDKTANQYTTIKGQSYNRTGAGFIALAEMTIVALIRIPAEALIFLGMLVMRFVPLFGPLFGLLAIPEQTRGAATAGMKVVAASIFNVTVFGVIAAVHTGLIAVLYVGSVNGGAANIFVVTVLSALCTYFLLKISKPYRSVTRLATGAAVSQELHGVTDGPGNLMRRGSSFLLGSAASAAGNVAADTIEKGRAGAGRFADAIGNRREAWGDKLQPEPSHPGPEDKSSVPAGMPQIHPGWMQEPPVNPQWSNAPEFTSGGTTTGSQEAASNDRIEPVWIEKGDNWPAEWDEPLFTPEAPTTSDLGSQRAGAIDPEIDASGHVVNTIFIPDDSYDVSSQRIAVDVNVDVPVASGASAPEQNQIHHDGGAS